MQSIKPETVLKQKQSSRDTLKNSQELWKIYRKTPVPESLFKKNYRPEAGVSCGYCEIFKSTFFIKLIPWLSLVKLNPSLCNQQNFSSSRFWQHLISWAPSTLWQNSSKAQCPRKNICGGVHSYCNSNLKTFKENKNTVCSDMYSILEVSLHSQSGWCFEIFSWIYWVLRARLYLTFIRRK